MKLEFECNTQSVLVIIITIILTWLGTLIWVGNHYQEKMEDCLKITEIKEEYVKCVGLVDYEKSKELLTIKEENNGKR